MKRGGPMRRRALSHANEDTEYAILRAVMLSRDQTTGRLPRCEACVPLRRAGVAVTCTIDATELHHLRKRSASGALADRRNVKRVCHAANMAIEDHPREAERAELVIREGHPMWAALSTRAWRKARM